MIKQSALLVFVFLITICQNSLAQGFTINGQISYDKTGIVYLRDIDYNLIDSSIISNGSFRLKGSIPIPDFYTITLNFSLYADDLFLENKTYQVNIRLDPFQMTSSGGYLDSLYHLFSENRRLPYFTISQLAKILNDSVWLGKKDLRRIKSELKITWRFIDSVQFNKDTTFINSILQTWLAPRLIASVLRSKKDLPVMRRYYAALHDSIKSSPHGNYLQKKILNLEASVSPGDQIHAFSVNDLQKKLIEIQAPLPKKYVLIDFWASWCKPCIEEFPVLKMAEAAYHSKGFSILSVSVDKDLAAWKKAVSTHALSWQQFVENRENADRLSKRLNIASVPANYLVDQNMKIIAIDLRGAQLLEMLEELLGAGGNLPVRGNGN
jgi:thiol-disulfide isomerase/thioredoxin